MYRCKDCGKNFHTPKIITERHNLEQPPYEKRFVCPECQSGEITENVNRYCRCCGAILRDGAEEYCDRFCRRRGQKLWENERRRYRRYNLSPLSKTVAQVDEYNRTHGTHLSYGQYVAYVLPQIIKGGEANEKG